MSAKTYWLVERGNPAEFLKAVHYGADDWTGNANEALQFPNKEMADIWVREVSPLNVQIDLRVCDHIWLDEPESQL